ncbi:plasmid replication protein RepC [Rhizobium sp. 18065]|uniref:plasmid replication protein RepC n=1 Tax=Rhizobium sp. 18065 TaxID=2681411 RepID=UPI00135CBB0E|nr:plasmid replication protein RepC [Rhizobium sp. 18065]
MQSGNVTTPFGRRGMTLALVKGQLDAAQVEKTACVNKWSVFRDTCEAKTIFKLHDRALAVLNALLSFFPESELAGDRDLIVFPSNAQLSLRAHGIAGTTLRRSLTALIEAGLIVRRDSPNGKRYAHRDRAGVIQDAFGFDLAPLLARAGEIAHHAQQVAAENQRFKRAKESLTLCRRDVRKLLSAAIEEGAAGNWESIEARYVALVATIKRHAGREEIENIASDMAVLRDEVVNMLEKQFNSEKMDGNADLCGDHIQNSNTESINELEPASEKEQDEKSEPIRQPQPLKTFPLELVLRACPQIIDYGRDGTISRWRDLMSAAVVVRSMLAVSPSAYEEACEVMGPENAAVAMACLLERAPHINSPGGYLRDLTRKTARGEFSLGPMLMALLRNAELQTARRA